MPSSTPDRLLAAPKLPKSKQVLILVDFINPLDFPGGEKLARPALTAARATARLRDEMEAHKATVVYANDNYGVWQSDFHTLVATCLGMDGPAGDVARLLYPQAEDLTILKPRHSAFFASPLDLLLAEMQARDLVICGLATDMCVQLTAMDAFLREFKAWVPADCTAAESAPAKAASLAYMSSILKCDTSPSARPASRKKPGKKQHA